MVHWRRGPARRRGAGAVRALYVSPLVGALLILMVAQPTLGQSGPWVPLGSRLDRLVAWAVADGALGRLDPLTRPFRLTDVERALTLQDTVVLSRSARRSVRWVREALAAAHDSTMVVAEAGAAGYSSGRRDSFRRGGAGGTSPFGGVRAVVVRAPFVTVLNPAIENRLRDDPEYTGYTKRVIAGRMQEAYVAVVGQHGDLAYGRMPRNWGPDLFDGLLISPAAYARDAISGSLRVEPVALASVAQRLDDWPNRADSAGPAISRYAFAHRLVVRAGGAFWVALTEAGVYGGPGRGVEPALHAPLNLALLSEFNEDLKVNALTGLEAAGRLGRTFDVAGSFLLDDIQVDKQQLSEQRPTSYALTLVARAAHPAQAAHVSVGYARVSSLTYRNSFEPFTEYSYRSVGLGHNFSDYDQVLLRIESRPTPRWYLALDVSHVRQGAGDFRDPFPSDSVLATPDQGFLLRPVARSTGVRATFDVEPHPGIEVRGEFGAASDGRGTRGIFGLSVRMLADLLRRRLVMGLPALDRGANRGWP